MIPSINKEIESYAGKKNFTFQKKFHERHAVDKIYHIFGDYCYHTGKYSGAAHSIGNIRYRIPT